MTPLSLATAHVATTPRDADHSLADTFARELLETHQRLETALSTNRRLVHERDAALARPSQPAKVWPLIVKCDGPRCTSVFAIDPAPRDEAQLALALQALGWNSEDGHRCPRCGGGR